MTQATPTAGAGSARPSAPLWQKLLPFAITAVCLVILYSRLEGAAAREGMGLVPYLARIFARVSWFRWLGLMIPYCIAFFLIDTLVLWKVVNWFNTRIGYAELIPVRGASYILSIVNEQVSKGAIGLYLNRRANVPGWEVGSSMLFIMVCEIYYLLAWATIGVLAQWDKFPDVFHAIPSIAVGAGIFFTLSHLFFSGRIGQGIALREKPLFHAFRKATVWNYLAVVLMRTPALLSAAVVYAGAAALRRGSELRRDARVLPVIFFGAATPGPMRSVAILLWVLLFPNNPGEMTAFGFVQHNFFILFNAGMGLIFIKRATQDLFGPSSEAKA